MEKPISNDRKFTFRLLKTAFILLFVLIGVSQNELYAALPYSYIQTLRFHKMDGYYFTMADSSFYVDIEGCSPDSVLVYSNDVPQGASFTSSRKERFSKISSNGTSVIGTHLIITFRFERPGSYQIRPLEVRVDGQYCQIPVDSVFVYENPNTVKPSLSLELEGGRSISSSPLRVTAGQHIVFTLYAQYAVQIVSIVSLDIPDNSIFSKVKEFEIVQGNPNGSDFSPKKVPVATFDWQPLMSGKYSWPKIGVIALSYSGRRQQIFLPEYTLEVSPGTLPSYTEDADGSSFSALGQAFSNPSLEDNVEIKNSNIVYDADGLLALYKRERHSLPLFSHAAKERKQKELSMAITPSTLVQPSSPLFFICLILGCVGGVVCIVLFLKKQKYLALLSLSFCMAFFIPCAIEVFALSQTFALFVGDAIYRIPEDVGRTSVEIPPCSIVRVEKKAGDWLFIHYNDTYGWVPSYSAKIIN